MSPETAESLSFWANAFAITALIVGVVSAYFIWLTGDIKETALKRELLASRERTAVLESSASASQERIAQLENETAEANRRAEADRLARIKIEQRLAPRRLSDEALSRICDTMRPHAEIAPGVKQSVAVFPVSPAFETVAFANQLAACLEQAGWNVNRNSVTYGISLTVAGVGMLTSSNPRSILVGESLSAVLNGEQMFAHVLAVKRSGCEEMGYGLDEISTNPWCSQVSVFVGDRP